MGAQNGDADLTLAALAERQHGVVTRVELLDAGLSRRQVQLRLERGQLHALYRGVYAVGHTQLTREGRRLAAARSAGPRGALFDVTAAAAHGLRESATARFDVVLPQHHAWTAQAGIRAHTSTTLRPEDLTTVDGIPVTSVARTVIDLAVRHPARLVERVLDELATQGRYDHRALLELCARPRIRGARELGAILAAQAAGRTVTKSDLEELLLAVCDGADLPRPWCNAWVAGLEVDAHWPGTPVVAELDSARFHTSRAAFERDRIKGNALVSAGLTLLRFTWRELTDHPERVAEQLGAALSAAASAPS